MVSDEALYEQWMAGELASFDQLYARYERPLFGFVRKHVRNPAEAEDLLHEAFMGVLRGGRERSGALGQEGRAITSFRAWLFQIARNLCLNRARAAGRASRALEVVARDEVPVAEPASGTLERHQAVAALLGAVELLPSPLAELYHLRVAGLSYEEMAGVVQAPVGTVKSRMHELVVRLREEMKPWIAG